MNTRDGAREENLLSAIRSAGAHEKELIAAPTANQALALLVNKLDAERDRLRAALLKVRSYNEDIDAGRINYRPRDHIQVIDAALAQDEREAKS